MTWVGRSVTRKEDPRLLTGTGSFVDDIDLPDQAWARVVRSPLAHARITGIRAGDAERAPGVIAVLTAESLGDVPRIPVRLGVDPRWLLPIESDAAKPRARELEDFLQPVLATDRARYAGEPVAVVVAEGPYLAEDAAELVDVSYQPLGAVIDATSAIQPEATPLWEGWGNEAARLRVGYGNPESAFAGAAHVVEATVKVGRHAAVPLEPRGLVARFDAATGRMEIWGATKVPNFNRRLIAKLLGLPDDHVHMHAVDAGGGFGGRGEFYPEDFLVPYLARALGRPVKWVEDRAEHLVAANQSREQLHQIAGAFDSDGRILALRDEIWHDNGAYLRTHGVAVPELTITMLPGPYRVPAFTSTIHVALTNKTPCGTYRAPGRYEGTFAREHLLDVAAGRMGIDPIELRRRNLLTPEELPHERAITALNTPMLLDPGDYPGLLAKALAHFEFAGWQREASTRRGAGHLVGAGLGFFMEKSGLGPNDTASAILEPGGAITIVSGGTVLGQGLETVMAQVAADELGLDPATIRVVHTESDLAPDGTGSWASRSTVLGGSAVKAAAYDLAAAMRRAAARLLEAAESEVVLAGGAAAVEGSRERRATFAEVAAALDDTERIVTRRFDVTHMTYPYGVHLALVETDEHTGEVRVLRFAVAYEVGRAVNPTLVEGQIRGGVAQGIGGALFEEFRYDEDGQPVTTTFMDYLLPAASELPPIETLILEDAPSAHNPLGVKGAGEAGITAAGAAIANSVRDALQIDGPLPGLPLTPEVVLGLIDGRAPGG